MRYFLFSWLAGNNEAVLKTSVGNITLSCSQFPGKRKVKEEIMIINSDVILYDIVITGVFEFRDEIDFINYTEG